MQQDHFPKIKNLDNLCDALQLCAIRKNEQDQDLIAIKLLDTTVREELANDFLWLDEYDGKPIRRIYSSGHVFLDESWEKVYLVEVEKNGTRHFQFTGWSPKEEVNKKAYHIVDDVLKIDLWVVESNAEVRTNKRTAVQVTDAYNDLPSIDRVLIEKQDDKTQEKYRSLVCLMHFLVKTYEGDLTPQVWEEAVIWWDRISLEDIERRSDIAPNVWVVVNHLKEKYLN